MKRLPIRRSTCTCDDAEFQHCSKRNLFVGDSADVDTGKGQEKEIVSDGTCQDVFALVKDPLIAMILEFLNYERFHFSMSVLRKCNCANTASHNRFECHFNV